MARPWRVQYKDAVYHVSGRGNNGRDIFLDDTDRLDFLDLLGRSADRFDLTIFCFCLMGNHYHLFLQTPKANLAAAMHWLNATYSMHFLHRRRQYGHFFQGRYKSVLILEDEHWRRLSYYIHLNPVRAKIVEDPGKYPWSSFQDYILRKPRFEWLYRDAILSDFGGTRLMARRFYQKDCLAMAGVSQEAWKEIRDKVVIGSREALVKIIEKHRPQSGERYVPDYKRSSRKQIEIENEICRVARAFKVPENDLKKRKRNFPAKLALYFHLVENCGWNNSQTAKYLAVSPNAVSLGIKRLKGLAFDNPALEKVVCSIKFKV